MKYSIIIPVYNEQEAIMNFILNLKNTLQNINISAECIFVDDNSTDNTSKILQEISDIKLITHSNNLGYGASIKTGIQRAGGDIICIIDCDNTYSPYEIQKLASFIDSYDMIIGARMNNNIYNFPFCQKMAKHCICLLLSLIFKQKILDINSGFRLMKKDIVKKYLPILPDGFSFTSSITLAMLLDNCKMKYVPVSYSKRIGKSKVNIFNYVINFIKSYYRIIYRACLTKYIKAQ